MQSAPDIHCQGRCFKTEVFLGHCMPVSDSLCVNSRTLGYRRSQGPYFADLPGFLEPDGSLAFCGAFGLDRNE